MEAIIIKRNCEGIKTSHRDRQYKNGLAHAYPTFDADVNAAAYYLTLCAETGRYPAFYVRLEA